MNWSKVTNWMKMRSKKILKVLLPVRLVKRLKKNPPESFHSLRMSFCLEGSSQLLTTGTSHKHRMTLNMITDKHRIRHLDIGSLTRWKAYLTLGTKTQILATELEAKV